MKVKNVTVLTEELANVFEELRKGHIELPRAAELNNTAGKMLSCVKVQLASAALRSEHPVIAFLGHDTKCLPQTT